MKKSPWPIWRERLVWFVRGNGYAKRLILRQSKVLFRWNSMPSEIELGLTFRCQCTCPQCSVWKPVGANDDGVLTTDEAKDLVDQATHLGCWRISFFGGEPLLRKDLPELINYAHRKGMLTVVTTNGLQLDAQMVETLKNAGLGFCRVSIDSPDPEIHDSIRGIKGLFDRCMKGMDLLAEAGIETQLSTVAFRENLQDNRLVKLFDIGRAHRARTVLVLFPMVSGKWADSVDRLLTREEEDYVRKISLEYDSKYVVVELPRSDTICRAQKKLQLYVSPYGDVSPCSPLLNTYGNIRQEPLEDLWNRLRTQFTEITPGVCPVNAPSFRTKYMSDRTSGLLDTEPGDKPARVE